MFQKVLTNGVTVSYGPTLPTTTVADGTIFYKTTTSTGYPIGFYVYGTRPDTNSSVLGPQVGQGWFSADPGDIYLKLTGGTLTGALGLTNYLRISATSTEQRILIGNTAATTPVIISSFNKVLSFGLGQSFTSNGGTLNPILKADFTNLSTGLKWNSNTVWHAGNDGANSGLDADMVDGMHATADCVASTVVARDVTRDIAVNRVNFLSTDGDDVVGMFITTNGSDGLSKKATVSNAREALRVDSGNDGVNRKTWNINISGSASSASEVNWNNISNKPTWLTDGSLTWNEIIGKPSQVNAYSFSFDANGVLPPESSRRTPSAAETVAATGENGVFSGIWFGEHTADAPRQENTLRDPNGGYDGAFPHYWAGFQAFTNVALDPNSDWTASGIQLVGNWNMENISWDRTNDPDGDNIRNVTNVGLMYRVADDMPKTTNDTTYLNKFSPWIKIWTNANLRYNSQLENDMGFATNSQLGGYLKLNTSETQMFHGGGPLDFYNQLRGKKSDGTQTILLNPDNGNIEAGGTITATSDFKTTDGNHETTKGRCWSDEGYLGVGNATKGGITIVPNGDISRSAALNFTKGGKNTNTTNVTARIVMMHTDGVLKYEINPNSVAGNTNSHHLFTSTVKSTGDVVAYASDGRLKTNVVRIETPVQKIRAIGGYTYDWDLEKCSEVGFNPSNPHEHGLIAQEVQEVVPDAVCESAIEGYLTVKYERIVPVLTAAISEQQETIESLTNEVAELKELVKLLMQKLD